MKFRNFKHLINSIQCEQSILIKISISVLYLQADLQCFDTFGNKLHPAQKKVYYVYVLSFENHSSYTHVTFYTKKKP